MLKGVVTRRNIEIHVGSTEALLPSSGTPTNWLIFTYLVLCHFQAWIVLKLMDSNLSVYVVYK